MQLHSNLLFLSNIQLQNARPRGVRLSLINLGLLEAEKVWLAPLIEVCKPLFHANPQAVGSLGNEYHAKSSCRGRFFLLYNGPNSFARVKTVRTRTGTKRNCWLKKTAVCGAAFYIALAQVTVKLCPRHSRKSETLAVNPIGPGMAPVPAWNYFRSQFQCFVDVMGIPTFFSWSLCCGN